MTNLGLNFDFGTAQFLQLEKNTPYTFSFQLNADKDIVLPIDSRVSSRTGNYTPDEIRESKTLHLKKGQQRMTGTLSVFNDKNKSVHNNVKIII